MSECVEKQALKSQLKLEADCGHVSTLQDVFGIIDFIPAADVRPVVRGRWENFRGKPKCSHCKAVWPEDYFQYNFCPRCGANMRPENDG